MICFIRATCWLEKNFVVRRMWFVETAGRVLPVAAVTFSKYYLAYRKSQNPPQYSSKGISISTATYCETTNCSPVDLDVMESSISASPVSAAPLVGVTTTIAAVSLDVVASNTTDLNLDSNITNISLAFNGSSSVSYGLRDLTWSRAVAVSVFVLLILITVIGNTLVILSVLTTRRLRTVTNCFVMNLAITDWLVGTCVMPPSVVLFIVGSWQFGWILCDIWISLDVLLCTASILSLCAISLDRYLAVIQPLTYSKKRRSKRLALLMILIVWITALLITCPPFLGWYEPERIKKHYVECRYNQNKGYVVFSAMGSFFIPLAIMLYVYLKIGLVLTSRRQRMVRDAVSERSEGNENECEHFVSESDHFQCNPTPKWPKFKNCRAKSIETEIPEQTTFYQLVEVSRLSSMMRCSTISCNNCAILPMQSIEFSDNRTSFSESCLSKVKLESGSKGGNNDKPIQHQGHSSSQAHHHHHRIPMRVSTCKRETKTAKTLTTVMGGFIACWLPFFCYYLMMPFLPNKAVSQSLMFCLTWVGWINCAINPFIYAFYNPDFRTAFWRLTFRKIFKRQPNNLTIFRG